MSERKAAAYRLGVDAEALAAEFLRAKGYRILAERWRTAGGEIDLLASPEPETLVVVEVKARKIADDGLYSVTPAKQRRLLRAGAAVLAQHAEFAGLAPLTHLNIRFDLIVITPDAPPLHLENAWQDG